MKDYKLKITRNDFEELQRHVFADLPNEAGAFALAGFVETNDSIDIIIRRPVEIPKQLFRVQNEVRLEVESEAINGMIGLCEVNKLGVVVCHSHPNESPYSSSDDFGERRLYKAFENVLPENMPMASLLFYPEGICGRVWIKSSGKPISIKKITVIGSNLQAFSSENSRDLEASSFSTQLYDRQIRAFGSDGQRLINSAKVGIVGVGGTGSAVAEQLVRVGVRDFVIIDPDDFEDSNLTRMYGTFSTAIKRPTWQFWRRSVFPTKKVYLIQKHLQNIQPQAKIEAFPMSVAENIAYEALLDRDIVFLCTDDHWGRSVVNQMVYQYYVPVLNLGMRIDAEKESIRSGIGVVDLLQPDSSCLWCKESLNSDVIHAQSLNSKDRQSLIAEGYVANVDTKEPSVISINTTLASFAVTKFLHMFTSFQGSFGSFERLNYYLMEDVIGRGTTAISNDCICRSVRAKGDLYYRNTLSS